MLTNAQKAAIRAAIFASTDPAVVEAREGTTRHDAFIDTWLNGASTQDAWMESVDRRGLFEAMTITNFDNLTAGKRDAWSLMLENAPIDFSRNKNRNAVDDIWGANAASVLGNLVRKATRAEEILGGNTAVNSGVTAMKLNWTGTVTRIEVGEILNG